MNKDFNGLPANTYYKFEDASEEEEVDFRIAELENDTEENDTENADTAVCPECGRKVEHEGGLWCAETADIQNADNCLRF